MKFDNKIRWFLFAYGCALIIVSFWVNYFLTKSESKKVSIEILQLKKEKAQANSEWARYQEILSKVSGLGQGWKKQDNKRDTNNDPEVAIPIKDAVAKQINEIERIHQEEILGKLSNAKRVYNEYRLKLHRDMEYQYLEKSKAIKVTLEADLESERERKSQALADFRKNLERKHQLTLINLELQKKMLIFSPIDSNNQQNEAERIELEIARIRGELKEETEKYAADLNRKFEIYQKRKTAEYNAELSQLRNEREKIIQIELSRFLEEQDHQFQAWKNQRQTEVEQAIKLRRVQQ